MPPPMKKRSPEKKRRCHHCNREWRGDKSGKFKALPDMEKLYLHFMHFQQVCTRALNFLHQKDPGDFRYLFEKEQKSENGDPKADSDAKKKSLNLASDSLQTVVTKETLQTICIGDKTYRITRDVKTVKKPETTVTASDPAESNTAKRKMDADEATTTEPKKSKVEDGESSGQQTDEEKKETSDQPNLSDSDLRASLMAAMNGEDAADNSPQFEMAKRMWKFVMTQMSEAEGKDKPDEKKVKDEKEDE